MAVPTIYKKLVDEYEKEELHKKADEIKRKLKHLRLMVSGSSALPESLF
jgi:acyl-CoA synthetase (AMP-forming)/AMP-acid ligase II